MDRKKMLRFEIKEKIGEGSFSINQIVIIGKVFKAFDNITNQEDFYNRLKQQNRYTGVRIEDGKNEYNVCQSILLSKKSYCKDSLELSLTYRCVLG